MRDSLKKQCDNFILNRDIIKSVFGMENQYIVSVCASDLAGKNIVVSAEKLYQCKKLIEQKTGRFSLFRGNVKLPIVTMLSRYDYPEQKMDKLIEIYNILRQNFAGTEYLILLASILVDMISVDKVDEYATRGKRIYELMKKEHPFLTSSEDSVFSVLMAFSDKEDNELISDMENCYNFMKKLFSDRNALQSLTHVLSLTGGMPIEKCDRVLSLYRGLENEGRRYGKYYEISVLGALSIVSTDVATMVNDIIAVDNFLSEQKGYGWFGFDKRTRLMHAAMLVSNDYSQESNIGVAALTGTLAMVAAQEATMCAMMIASATATASNIN